MSGVPHEFDCAGMSARQGFAAWRHSRRGVLLCALLALALGGCANTASRDNASGERSRPPASTAGAPPAPSPSPLSPKYYKDDGPANVLPADLDLIPDAVPKLEPINRFTSRPYTVLGRDYVPATTLRPYKERGIASWYGRKFHGQKTSTGETYDMFAMTAAHPTLPLPSYVRVTNAATGQTVVVRVNDRGPFLHDRVIDLSYAAAHRIGVAAKGSGEVVVEAILPPEAGTLVATAPLPSVAAPGVAQVATPKPGSPAVAVAPSAAETASAPITREAGGFAVQLGVFANNVNAQNFLTQVRTQLAPAEVAPKIREANGMYRVYVGPFAERDEARRMAERITGAFGLAAAVAPHP